MFRSIRWRIALPYVALILLAMAGLVVYLSSLVRSTYWDNLEDQLAAEARLIVDMMESSFAYDRLEGNLDPIASHYADLLDVRVTVIDAEGIVLGESHEDRTQMDNHLYRPEVQEALATGEGSSIRYSRTVSYDMMYVAVPITSGGEQVIGFVRVALPLRQIEFNLMRLRWVVVLAAAITASGATLLAILIAGRTTQPVRQLTLVVQHMEEGDLNARLLPITRDEVGKLTQAFNRMGDRLRHTITSLVEEQGLLTAVLNNMADGVVITDGEGCVRLINPTAAQLLGVGEEAALGRSFAEVSRDHRIIDLWRRCHRQSDEHVEPIVVSRYSGMFLQVIVTPLQGDDPGACLVIIQDLTQVRRLEAVRRDLVSNISHELRTPLASLKALTDTLRDGALDDPPAAQRFLDRMETEVDALTQMVEELLELSRIESGQVPFEMASRGIGDVIMPTLERLYPQIERADLRIAIDVPPDIPVLVDAARMRQVITNLVHNAIKFTPGGGRIQVSASEVQVRGDGTIRPAALGLKPGALPPGEWVLITVQDTGVGIPADDLPRIFERFYKADRARSGGGTGLGLSIAKHVVQAHNGYIWAESIEGRGSTFYVALPALTPR